MGGRDAFGRRHAAVQPAMAVAIVVAVVELAVATVWLAAPAGAPVPFEGEAVPLHVVGDTGSTPWLALAVRKHAPRRVESLLHVTVAEWVADTDAAPAATPRAVRETMLRRTLDAAWVAANDLAGAPVPTHVHALVGANPVLERSSMIRAVDGDPTDVPAALARAAAHGSRTSVTLTVEDARGRTSTRSLAVGALGDLAALRPWAVAVDAPPRIDLPKRIRGGSIGLVAALFYLDRVTPGALTAGHLVAASGTIDPSGRVGRVASLPWKLDAAARARATIVLLPAANAADVAAADRAAPPVVTVDSLAGAVGVLCERGATAACAVAGASLPA